MSNDIRWHVELPIYFPFLLIIALVLHLLLSVVVSMLNFGLTDCYSFSALGRSCVAFWSVLDWTRSDGAASQWLAPCGFDL